MAARLTKGTKDIPWDQRTRDKIKTSMLINRLQDHVLKDGVNLLPTQIQAAKVLLDRTLPTLVAQQITGDVAHFVARLPAVAPDAQSWLRSSQSLQLIPPTLPSSNAPDDK